MKRKLTPLIASPELHHINKTMIIKVPSEFRECGHPAFRVVSSLDDLEKPRVKFKANDILKTILAKGTGGKKMDTICVDVKQGNSLKQTEFVCEKPISNDKVPNGCQSHKTKTSHQVFCGCGTDCSTISSSGDSSLKQATDQFYFASKNSSQQPSHFCKSVEAHKGSQKTSAVSIKEQHLPLSNKLDNEHENAKVFKNFCIPELQESFKLTGYFVSSQEVNGNINYGSSREMINQNGLSTCINHSSDSSQAKPNSYTVTTQKREGFDFQTPQQGSFGPSQEVDHCRDCRSFQQKEYQKPKSLQQKNPALRMYDKRNCDLDKFQQFQDNDSQHFQGHDSVSSSEQKPIMIPNQCCQCSSDNDKPLSSSGQSSVKLFSQHHDDAVKTDEQKLSYVNGAGVGSENVYSNKPSLCSVHRAPHWERSDSSQGVPGYSSNKNNRVPHHEEQRQKTHGQMSTYGNKRQHQGATENVYKTVNEFPKHCMYKKLNWLEVKQMLFLDIRSYPNFFCEFEEIPPPGMHIWVFMPLNFRLKYPNQLVNHRLLNMRLLHIACGNIDMTLPEMIKDLHYKLLQSSQFIVISNKQFDIEKSIKTSRTISLIVPKFSQGMREIYKYIFSR